METLDRLVSTLNGMVTLLGAEAAPARPVRACSILEPPDVEATSPIDRSDEIVLLIGQTIDRLPSALRLLASARPALVMAKSEDPERLRALAEDVGITLVAHVNADVPWGQLHGLIERIIVSTPQSRPEPDDAAEHTVPGDLFSIAKSLADQLDGYVSIDDMQSRVLAFSPLDEGADELRRDSILGRGAPPGHREQLRAQGVWEQLKRPGQVIELGRDGDIMPRLAVGIIDESTQTSLGTIWVQRGRAPFPPRARQILVAGAALAAQTILRTDYLDSRQSETVLQLIGLRRGTESRRTLAAILGLADSSSWLIVAFTAAGTPAAPAGRLPVSSAALMRLHAATIRTRAQVTISERTAYVIVPDPPSPTMVQAWAETTRRALETPSGPPVRCVIGPVVDNPRDLPTSRESVDAMIEDAAARNDVGVTTYSSRRAHLQLSRAVRLLWEKGVLTGEPIEEILRSGYVDGHQLLRTARVYFDSGRRAREAATELHLHPNTLRQRLRRIERITGLDLDDVEERLLLELELRAHAEGLTRESV